MGVAEIQALGSLRRPGRGRWGAQGQALQSVPKHTGGGVGALFQGTCGFSRAEGQRLHRLGNGENLARTENINFFMKQIDCPCSWGDQSHPPTWDMLKGELATFPPPPPPPVLGKDPGPRAGQASAPLLSCTPAPGRDLKQRSSHATFPRL